MNDADKRAMGYVDSVESKVFILNINQIVEPLLTDTIRLKGFLITLDLYYFGKPGQGERWKNFAEAKDDIIKNGIPEPIDVEKEITPDGIKYKVITGLKYLVLANESGLKEVPAIEVIRTKVKQN